MHHATSPASRLALGRSFTRMALACALLVGSVAHAADDKETLRAEVATPLAAAQELLKSGKALDALTKLREVDAVGNRTAYENFILERTRGAAAVNAKDTPLALAAFTKVIDSGRLPKDEQLKLIEGLVDVAYKGGQKPAAEQWARRFFAEGGQSEGVRTILIQLTRDKGDDAGLLEQLKLALAEDAAAQRPVNPTKLHLQAEAQYKLKDFAGYRATLERLVQIKPKTEYWAAIIDQLQRQPGWQQRLSLDLLRLMRQLDLLATAEDYLDMAQLAQQAGQPGEAKAVLDEGFAKNLLGQGKDAAAHTQLRQKLNKAAAEDQASFASGQAAAAKAKDGNSQVALGQALVTAGQVEPGLALMAQGLAKGVAKNPDDAKLRYGVALLTHGQRDKALPVLQGLTAADGSGDLARLWLIAVP